MTTIDHTKTVENVRAALWGQHPNAASIRVEQPVEDVDEGYTTISATIEHARRDGTGGVQRDRVFVVQEGTVFEPRTGDALCKAAFMAARKAQRREVAQMRRQR